MILLLAASVWIIALLIASSRSVTLSKAKGLRVAEILRFAQNDTVRDVLAIGILGAATAGFFWRLLFGNMWMPAGGGDLAQFLYPTYTFATKWWRLGVIPLWNPHLFGGMSFVGDIQSGIFYPLNLITFFITSPLTFRDMEFLSVLHFFIAGAGMYLFLRFGKWGIENQKFERKTEISNSEFRISILPALAGALAFEFSDLFITHFGNLNLIATIAWMPLVLLFYHRAVTDRRASFAAIAGTLLAVAFLAGHIQMFLFIVIALGLFAVYHVSRFTHHAPRITTNHLPLTFLALTALIAFGLSAPALVPSIEMTQNTVRAEFSYEQAAQFSLPPAQLIGLVAPGFFGRGPQAAWGPWQRVEVGYIGILPLVLALLALILRRDAPPRFLGLFAAIGLAFALGGFAILHGWLYQFIPGFGQLRAPARFIVLFDFAIAALTAFGFDYLLHALPRTSEIVFKRIVRAAPWAFLIIAIPAGALAYSNLVLGQGQDAVLFARIANATNALAFFILLFALSLALILARATRFFRAPVWATLALALIFFDLFSLGAYVDLSADDPTRVYDHPDAGAFFNSIGGIYRIDARGTGVDNAWTPDTAILYNLHDVGGDNPLVLADFDRYWESLGSRSSALYDLLNTQFVIGRKNMALDRDKFKLAYDGDPALNIYENTRALPRAFVVNAVRIVADKQAAFDAIHADDFDPARTVVLESKDARLQTTDNRTPATLKIVGYGPNEIVMETNTPSDGVLVLSEVYYPGWRAWVDNQEVKVLRANFLFRAIELPTGSHHIRMLYDPLSFKLGAGLFTITLIGLLAFTARNKFAR